MLQRTQGFRLAAGSSGRLEWTIRFVARNPGQTDLVFRRQAVGPSGSGEIGERFRFRIRIMG